MKNKPFRIVDTTLRDGAQMPGIVLSLDDKCAIVDELDTCGIPDIEIGFPASSAEEFSDIRTIKKIFTHLGFSVWARARKDDIEKAADTDVSAVHISFPVSDTHIRLMRWTQKRVLTELQSLIRYAKTTFASVSVGAQDATRAPLPFLKEFMETAHDAGVDSIRIADTVGIATPDSIASLLHALTATVPSLPIEFHGHNDFGLATANALSALQAGASAVSCTVCGVGERAGNAALEQVASAGTLLYPMSSSISLRHLPSLCTRVRTAFNLPGNPCQPIVGENAFAHESGIHCHGMLRDSTAYQPCHASVFGHATRYVLGMHAGSSTLQAYFQTKGISISRADAAKLLPNVKGAQSPSADTPDTRPLTHYLSLSDAV